MKKIELSKQGKNKGKYSVSVDDRDFNFLNQWRWSFWNLKGGDLFYAVRQDYKTKRDIRMHRLIMNCPKDKQVDHINGNGLDNRRSNLRICSVAENQRNSKVHKDNKSGYKGVSWNKEKKKWHVCIRIGKENKSLGYFISKIDAATAFNKTAKKYFGKFARLNVI